MRFITTIKHTTGIIGDAIAGTGIGSIEDNGMGVGGKNGVSSSSNNSMGFSGEVDIGSISMGSGSDNDVDFSVEVGADGNLGDEVVYLGVLSTMVIGPASSWFNIVVPTSFTAGRNYSTPVSSVVQVG